MKSSSSSTMAPALADYHKRSARLFSEILESEEERVRLDQKLSSLLTVDSRLKQREQVDDVQSRYGQLNQESERARQRNFQLLNDIQQAEQHLDRLRKDAEHLIRLKGDYTQYLKSTYPAWQQPGSATVSAIVNTEIYDFDRLRAYENNGNHRLDPSTLQPVPPHPVTTHKQHDDHHHHSVISDEHQNPSLAGHRQVDDPSLSDSNSSALSRSKRTASLRMELNRTGLYFLLDYIEKELPDTIDKKKFYHHDEPTINQKRDVLAIASDHNHSALKGLDPATTSMVILDQLPSTIRRTTVNQCLLTEDILSLNVIDLDKDAVTKLLPDSDRALWTRLIDHFTRLLKYHIMNSQALANKFAPILSPNNVIYLHEKAKSLLKHIVDKLIGTQQSSSEDETSTARNQTVAQLVKANPVSSWLSKLSTGGGLDEDEDTSSTSTITKKNVKSASSTPRANINPDDSDLEFYS